MKKTFTLLLTLFALQGYSQIKSSELVSSAGGNFYQIYAKMDWTIGETVIETFKANNNYLSQGFIQGASSSLNAVKESQFKGLSVEIYPNPFHNQIQVNFNELFQNKEARIVIYDILGKEVLNKDNLKEENRVYLDSFSAGVYIVKIYVNNQDFSTIRIEKLD